MTHTTPTVYDMIIIGTGSGNSIPGPSFAGKKIAICEEGRFGGTCLNVGCIPTKMEVYTADIARLITDSDRFGLSAELTGIDWAQIKHRIFEQRIDPIASGGEAYRRGDECPNIDVFDGHARFVGEKTIATSDGETPVLITADTIVLACGARPQILDVIEKSGVDYSTNEDILRIDHLPESMIILGGGFIAAEFAHVFSSLGVAVTQINRSPRLLKHLDDDVSDRFTELASSTWRTLLGRTVSKASQTKSPEDGTRAVTLTLDNGETVTAETLLVATGRTPNGDMIGADKAGIALEGTRVKVDDYGRTTAPGVWALGDVSSPYQLKHVANAEMRTVVHNITHPDDLQRMPHEHVPAAIFTHPQIATVGLTEKQAHDTGAAITVKVQAYGDVAYGWALEDTTGFVKLIAEQKSGKLLGAHIIGPQASTLIQQLVTVMAYGISLQDFARNQYWIHPALPELIENAVLGLDFS